MNVKRLALAALACWVVYMLLNYAFHGVLLRPTYLKYAGAMREEAQSNAILPIGFAAALAAFFAFTYLFARGSAGGNGLVEGLRFGLLVATMICGFALVWEFMVWPMGPRLFGAWVVDAFVEFSIYGIVTGVIYKPLAGAARPVSV
jgi:hypothetical protein